MIGESRVEVDQEHTVVFPNGVTATYNEWAGQIIVKPPEDRWLRSTSPDFTNPYHGSVVIEVR